MNFKPNVGKTDRLIRTIMGIYGILLGFLFIQGWVGILLGVVGVVALATGLSGWCGLYTLLGKSTLEPEASVADSVAEQESEVEVEIADQGGQEDDKDAN